MNIRCTHVIVALFGCGVLSAQNTEPLEQRIKKSDSQACLEAGEKGRADLIPLLEQAAHGCNHPVAVTCAAPRQALAKLGVRKYLDEILVELTATTNSPAYRAEIELRSPGLPSGKATAFADWATKKKALQKLSYVRDKSTVRIVASFLYDKTDWKAILPESDDAIYTPICQTAAQTLSEMKLDNAPPGNPMWDVKAWQQWWEQNKDKYP